MFHFSYLFVYFDIEDQDMERLFEIPHSMVVGRSRSDPFLSVLFSLLYMLSMSGTGTYRFLSILWTELAMKFLHSHFLQMPRHLLLMLLAFRH